MWSSYLFHYTLLIVVYAIILVAMWWWLVVWVRPSSRKRLALTAENMDHNLPSHLIDLFGNDLTWIMDTFDRVTYSFLNRSRNQRILLLEHPNLADKYHAMRAHFPQHRYRMPRRDPTIPGHAQTLSHLTRGLRYDAIFSIFDINHANEESVLSYVPELRRCARRGGIVFVRMIVRRRSDKNAIISCFDRHFSTVRYGFMNYSLLYVLHAPLLLSLLLHEARFGAREQHNVRRWEWLHYGQLLVFAKP